VCPEILASPRSPRTRTPVIAAFAKNAGRAEGTRILATVYHRLGVNPETVLADELGHPVPIQPETRPVTELCG
jgi:hypothetical protein